MIDLKKLPPRVLELSGAAVIMLLLLGASFWYIATHKAPSSEVPGNAASSGTSPAVPQTITEHAQYYDIEAAYPGETPLKKTLGSVTNARAIGVMKEFIDSTVTSFKTEGNFTNLTKEDIQMMGFDQGRKESLDIKYAEKAGAATLSYEYTIYMDTLGAHPNGFFKTFMFDTASGKQLQLADLFLPKAKYLDRLSAITRFELGKTLGPDADVDYINDGTKPTAESFADFLIDGPDLLIIFPPYQVAAYAAGPQTVTIPLSQLGDILKPEYKK